tara:strand:- start:46 stop:336 length:291 start_codon:yes stop_codon:yes gene_type:complete
MLEKLYWLFLDSSFYVILYLIFILLVIGVLLKTMIDKIFYSLFGALDNIWNFSLKAKNKKGENMIDKIKKAAMHYWTDHREVVIIVSVILAICIIQ